MTQKITSNPNVKIVLLEMAASKVSYERSVFWKNKNADRKLKYYLFLVKKFKSKENINLNDSSISVVRYCLIVSIETADVEMDPYTPVMTMIENTLPN